MPKFTPVLLGSLVLIVLFGVSVALPGNAGRVLAEPALPEADRLGLGQPDLDLANPIAPVPRVDAPYADPAHPGGLPPQRAIFWFGAVDPTGNYADGRVFFDDEKVTISFHVIDRQLYYDLAPSVGTLTDWDAVTLFLDMEATGASPPGQTAYRLEAQLNHTQPRASYQAAYQGDGSGWLPVTLDFTTKTGWRGAGLNGPAGDHGWYVVYRIPFTSLGLTERPADGTVWRLAAVVHDRDDVAGSAIPDRVWPSLMTADDPQSWAVMGFGLPEYDPPPVEEPQEITIRQGLDGASVVDAHVGGNSTCGEGLDVYTEWGEANYAGLPQVNVQNQWDIADWPCFSKYYITFPLDSVPAGQTIAEATLTMYQFGNAGMGFDPPSSLIQVLTIAEDWDEETITWNNAPQAQEYVAATWVDPISEEPGAADVPHEWDISRAAAEAYAASQPLRLVVYSADTAQHSGRYFWGSDVEDWNEEERPSLRLIWGQAIPPGTDPMHVGDLDGQKQGGQRGGWEATVTVLAHDENENPLVDATVNGSWSDGASGSAACTTDGNGACQVSVGNLDGGVASVTFTVDSMSATGYVYEAGSNHDPDGDSDPAGTVIVVYQDEPPPPPGEDPMHVGDLDGVATAAPRGGQWNATVTIAVHDVNHQPLDGVTAGGTWGGGTSGVGSCVTGSAGSGQCSVVKSNLPGTIGSISFTVDSLADGNGVYIWEMADDHDPDGDSNPPGEIITILKP